MSAGAPAPHSARASHRFIIHTSTAAIGGAESSLLAAVQAAVARSTQGKEFPAGSAAEPGSSAVAAPHGKDLLAAAARGLPPLFLVPAEGPLSREVSARGWDFRIVPWPAGLSLLTQRRWLWSPLVLPGLLPYLLKLRRIFASAQTVWSSGFKSHCACLLLAGSLGPRLLFDVRDFLKPMAARRWIARASAHFGCRVRANSHAVAADYPGAEVGYPQVALRRPARNGRPAGGKRIIAHLAYFAPYKGQDLFLDCARKLIDAGVDAEFWIIGDVIYPAAEYQRYREHIHERVARLGLTSQVRLLGKVGGEEAQSLLERTHLLLHCTREPEPFGRAVLEALLCGCEAICHRASGVCEVVEKSEAFPEWARPLRDVLGPEYVAVGLKESGDRPLRGLGVGSRE